MWFSSIAVSYMLTDLFSSFYLYSRENVRKMLFSNEKASCQQVKNHINRRFQGKKITDALLWQNICLNRDYLIFKTAKHIVIKKPCWSFSHTLPNSQRYFCNYRQHFVVLPKSFHKNLTKLLKCATILE